jgi:hypothetical protein
MKITTETLKKITDNMALFKVFAGFFPSGEATWDEVIAVPGYLSLKIWLSHNLPASVIDCTWDKRVALQIDEHDRMGLAMWCPFDVPGSTWEARMSLLRDYESQHGFYKFAPNGIKDDPRCSIREKTKITTEFLTNITDNPVAIEVFKHLFPNGEATCKEVMAVPGFVSWKAWLIGHLSETVLFEILNEIPHWEISKKDGTFVPDLDKRSICNSSNRHSFFHVTSSKI